MKALIDSLVRQFTTSVHFVGAQTLEFIDDDDAEGVVYCDRSQHDALDGQRSRNSPRRLRLLESLLVD